MDLHRTKEGFALYKEKTQIGFCTLTPAPKGAAIAALCIQPQWRRKGYGSYFLKEILRSFAGYAPRAGRVISGKEGCNMEHKTVGFAVCGSFCTHHRAMEALEAVKARYDHVIPIVSEVVADTDTRFGTAHDLMREMERICDHRVIATQKEAEPIGPKGLLDLLIIAPCTGSTLGKLACGIADTTVTLAAKAHLRNCRPILLAPSTNDGLAASARNLGQLMARKYIYLVPFRQDDPEEKPASLVADFSLVADAAQAALEGRQLQPVLLGPAAP